MELSDFFSAVGFKTLRPVDLPHLGSNQHEVNGVSQLREFFKTDTTLTGVIHWFYFADGQDPVSADGEFTFYDAREKSSERTGRSEWRWYYTGDFLARASVDDVLILAKESVTNVFALVFQQESTWLQGARILFGFENSSQQYQLLSEETLSSQTLEFTRQRIIEALGLEIVIPSADADRELVVRIFGNSFPQTKAMSQFARSLCKVDARLDADTALITWIQREEELFRALEDVIVSQKLKVGFEDVDDFVTYSLSVQNRRKSRMGFALMHHLAAVFDAHRLKYEREALTERKNKPDFLFPGKSEYHDPTFDPSSLVMLASKSSAKDRWRQVLTEADRIPIKHLCTLEPGISRAQTWEMSEKHLILVIPTDLHQTYLPDQRDNILSITQFIAHVKSSQTAL